MSPYVRITIVLVAIMVCLYSLSCCSTKNSYDNYSIKEGQLKSHLESIGYPYTYVKNDECTAIYTFKFDNIEYEIALDSSKSSYNAHIILTKEGDLEWKDVEPLISVVNVISSKQYEKKDITDFFENDKYIQQSTDNYYCKYKNFDFGENFIFEYSKYIDTKTCGFSVVGEFN